MEPYRFVTEVRKLKIDDVSRVEHTGISLNARFSHAWRLRCLSESFQKRFVYVDLQDSVKKVFIGDGNELSSNLNDCHHSDSLGGEMSELNSDSSEPESKQSDRKRIRVRVSTRSSRPKMRSFRNFHRYDCHRTLLHVGGTINEWDHQRDVVKVVNKGSYSIYKSRYRWEKKHVLTREKLDYELDQYMAETALLRRPNTSEDVILYDAATFQNID